MTAEITLNWTPGIEAEVLNYCTTNQIEITLGFPYWNGLCDTLDDLRLATPNGQNGVVGDYELVDHDDGTTAVTLTLHCASADDAQALTARFGTTTTPATAPETDTNSGTTETGSTPPSDAGAGA